MGAFPWPIIFVALVSMFSVKICGHTNINEINVTHTAMSAGAMAVSYTHLDVYKRQATDLSMIESTMQKLRQIAKESSIVVMLPQGASEAELCSDNVDDLERYLGDENSDFSAVLGSAATVALTAVHSLSDEETEIYLWSEEKPQKLSDLLIVSGE